MRSVSKQMRLSELTVKIWMNCQRQRCSPMTLVSANIRFVPIFEGVPWRQGVKQPWGNRKHGFSQLSTLRLRQLWKSGQSYYTVGLIFSLLSSVHWPQNTWPLMTLIGLNIHFYRPMHFSAKRGIAICLWGNYFFLLIYCRVCLCMWPAKNCGKWSCKVVIRWIFENWNRR